MIAKPKNILQSKTIQITKNALINYIKKILDVIQSPRHVPTSRALKIHS